MENLMKVMVPLLSINNELVELKTEVVQIDESAVKRLDSKDNLESEIEILRSQVQEKEKVNKKIAETLKDEEGDLSQLDNKLNDKRKSINTKNARSDDTVDSIKIETTNLKIGLDNVNSKIEELFMIRKSILERIKTLQATKQELIKRYAETSKV